MVSNKAAAGLAPLVAIVGSDGSGKSTISADLIDWLAQSRPVEGAYLGLGTGDMGNRIKEWPIVGRWLERKLTKKAGQARDKKAKIPGLPTALVIYTLSRIRLRRFNRMMARRRQGIFIVTDRYPQTEFPGIYDGPGLSAARAEGRLLQKLVKRERALYEEMASHIPSLIIRLNIDADTALQRKPDHKRALLETKVAITPQLKFGGAQIVDLSSLDPYETVLAGAKKAILEMLHTLGEEPKAI